ncbi:MAG: plasmid stabilization protein [Actinomycetota bacterium]|nr:plasmid stabilization protein [Actinomycetota bacterium]
MATLTIRNVDDELRAELQVRAARNGRSMEAEVRAILRETVSRSRAERGLGTRIHQHFADVGGVDLELPPRTEMPRAAELPE